MKKCNGCNQEKCLDQFYKNKLGKDGVGSQCKICSNSASIAWYKANVEVERLKKSTWRKNNPNKVENQNRRDNLKTYGLSIEDWNVLFSKQKGLCAICNQPETVLLKGKIKRLAVDHCHTTGKVRALLCAKCNKAIGLMKDQPELLRQAAQYLELHIL